LTRHFSADTGYCPENKIYILENNSAPLSQVNRKGTHSLLISRLRRRRRRRRMRKRKRRMREWKKRRRERRMRRRRRRMCICV